MILNVQHIAKSFGEKQVLINVSFSLEKGTINVLMGTNGSGKTTLFNILTGFLDADHGTCLLGGKKLDHTSPHLINRNGITRSFQDLRLITELTVLQNILLSFQEQQGENWWKALLPNHSVREQENSNMEKACTILEECFLTDVADSNAGEISYGQQKLLTMACCIANDAEVILLDEPVSGINPSYQGKLTDIIKDLKKKGKAVLIIEHNSDFIKTVVDQILFLNEGHITSYKNYEDLRNDEFVQEAYI